MSQSNPSTSKTNAPMPGISPPKRAMSRWSGRTGLLLLSFGVIALAVLRFLFPWIDVENWPEYLYYYLGQGMAYALRRATETISLLVLGGVGVLSIARLDIWKQQVEEREKAASQSAVPPASTSAASGQSLLPRLCLYAAIGTFGFVFMGLVPNLLSARIDDRVRTMCLSAREALGNHHLAEMMLNAMQLSGRSAFENGGLESTDGPSQSAAERAARQMLLQSFRTEMWVDAWGEVNQRLNEFAGVKAQTPAAPAGDLAGTQSSAITDEAQEKATRTATPAHPRDIKSRIRDGRDAQRLNRTLAELGSIRDPEKRWATFVEGRDEVAPARFGKSTLHRAMLNLMILFTEDKVSNFVLADYSRRETWPVTYMAEGKRAWGDLVRASLPMDVSSGVPTAELTKIVDEVAEYCQNTFMVAVREVAKRALRGGELAGSAIELEIAQGLVNGQKVLIERLVESDERLVARLQLQAVSDASSFKRDAEEELRKLTPEKVVTGTADIVRRWGDDLLRRGSDPTTVHSLPARLIDLRARVTQVQLAAIEISNTIQGIRRDTGGLAARFGLTPFLNATTRAQDLSNYTELDAADLAMVSDAMSRKHEQLHEAALQASSQVTEEQPSSRQPHEEMSLAQYIRGAELIGKRDWLEEVLDAALCDPHLAELTDGDLRRHPRAPVAAGVKQSDSAIRRSLAAVLDVGTVAERAELCYAIGRALVLDERYDEALAALQVANELLPDEPLIGSRLAQALLGCYRHGPYEEHAAAAMELLDRAAGNARTHGGDRSEVLLPLYVLQSQALLATGKANEAITLAIKAEEIARSIPGNNVLLLADAQINTAQLMASANQEAVATARAFAAMDKLSAHRTEGTWRRELGALEAIIRCNREEYLVERAGATELALQILVSLPSNAMERTRRYVQRRAIWLEDDGLAVRSLKVLQNFSWAEHEIQNGHPDLAKYLSHLGNLESFDADLVRPVLVRVLELYKRAYPAGSIYELETLQRLVGLQIEDDRHNSPEEWYRRVADLVETLPDAHDRLWAQAQLALCRKPFPAGQSEAEKRSDMEERHRRVTQAREVLAKDLRADGAEREYSGDLANADLVQKWLYWQQGEYGRALALLDAVLQNFDLIGPHREGLREDLESEQFQLAALLGDQANILRLGEALVASLEAADDRSPAGVEKRLNVLHTVWVAQFKSGEVQKAQHLMDVALQTALHLPPQNRIRTLTELYGYAAKQKNGGLPKSDTTLWNVCHRVLDDPGLASAHLTANVLLTAQLSDPGERAEAAMGYVMDRLTDSRPITDEDAEPILEMLSSASEGADIAKMRSLCCRIAERLTPIQELSVVQWMDLVLAGVYLQILGDVPLEPNPVDLPRHEAELLQRATERAMDTVRAHPEYLNPFPWDVIVLLTRMRSVDPDGGMRAAMRRVALELGESPAESANCSSLTKETLAFLRIPDPPRGDRRTDELLWKSVRRYFELAAAGSAPANQPERQRIAAICQQESATVADTLEVWVSGLLRSSGGTSSDFVELVVPILRASVGQSVEPKLVLSLISPWVEDFAPWLSRGLPGDVSRAAFQVSGLLRDVCKIAADRHDEQLLLQALAVSDDFTSRLTTAPVAQAQLVQATEVMVEACLSARDQSWITDRHKIDDYARLACWRTAFMLTRRPARMSSADQRRLVHNLVFRARGTVPGKEHAGLIRYLSQIFLRRDVDWGAGRVRLLSALRDLAIDDPGIYRETYASVSTAGAPIAQPELASSAWASLDLRAEALRLSGQPRPWEALAMWHMSFANDVVFRPSPEGFTFTANSEITREPRFLKRCGFESGWAFWPQVVRDFAEAAKQAQREELP